MRNFLKDFPTENIEITDEKDNLITKVDGLFGKTCLTVTDVSIPITEGQIVKRKLPNGFIEKYEIIESKYVKGINNICDFYKLFLKKENINNQTNKYNIYNDNSIHIGDNNKIDRSIIGNND